MRFLNRRFDSWAGRLSRHRRGPVAGLLLIVLGLLLTGGLYSAFTPASAEQTQSDEALVAKGRQLFLVSCAFCHGQNGQGVKVGDGSRQIGPSLVGVGAAAVDFQVGTGRMPMARPGVQAPKKDVVYTPEEISALAAYVASLGPGPSIPQQDEYDPLAIPADQREEAIVQGGEFFRTNCTACHNFAASGGALPGGKYAPSLKGVTEKHIYEAMLTGPQQMPVFSDEVLKPDEKREVIAYLKSIEDAPRYGGGNMGAFGPVSEGLFAWLVGIGACVGFAVWIASTSTRSKKGAQS